MKCNFFQKVQTQARRDPKRPWFLYLAYNAPHFPLHAPRETIAKYAKTYSKGWDEIREQRLQRMKKLGIIPKNMTLTPRSRFFDWGESEAGKNPAWSTLSETRQADLARRMAIYAAMIDRMDQNLGRVFTDLRRSNEWENTLIIFISDNGACAEWDPFGFDGKSGPENKLHRDGQLDQMGSRGTYHSVGSGWANASNTPWRLYKHFNHEGGITSPALIHWPAQIKQANKILSTPSHLIDLMPTFIEAAKMNYPEKLKGGRTMPLPGESLLPLLHGDSIPERTLFFEHEGNRAVRKAKWKLVALRGMPWELYDISNDRVEMHDLAKEQPKLVRQLASEWQRWAKSHHVTPLPTDYGVPYVPVEEESKP